MDTVQSDEPIEYPITGELDLHTFRPDEIQSLVCDYINECFRIGLSCVRIIHGKGKSVQKSIVRKALQSHPLVCDFSDAPPESGGWGATMVNLKIKSK